MIIAAATALALCKSTQLSASVAGFDRAMMHVYATVAVKNRSASPCAIGPNPGLMLVDLNQQNGRELAASGPRAAPRITLAPGKSASFVVSWSMMAPGGAECRAGMLNGWLYAGGGGLPLWLPLGTTDCDTVNVTAYRAGVPAQPGNPSDSQLADYTDWSQTQPCRAAFIRTENFDRGPKPDAPAVHDALVLHLPPAEISDAATRPDVEVPSVWVDPDRAIFSETSEEFGQYDTFLCGRIISLPSLKYERSLANIATKHGVRLGMSPDEVRRLEGRASLHTVASNTQTLFYRWSTGSGDDAHTRTLAFTFWKNELFGMHYQDAPVHHAP